MNPTERRLAESGAIARVQAGKPGHLYVKQRHRRRILQ
eukprot:CAMPEP_0179347180 /NCGR_PEP_ID=MMETSP0797-20121207/72981_1 /TAXON_ID=47934 /ORGANISM="Dinophysis acuminata, Strain DAEP01" /LENGTH=37 /DNA_ID= /DNA_START= /DNA_END= /DNA_ORIENTATION=